MLLINATNDVRNVMRTSDFANYSEEETVRAKYVFIVETIR